MQNEFFTLQKLELNNYKLSQDNVKTLSTYNAIDSIGFSINMLYNDVTDIKNKMPLRGGEELEFIVVDRFKNRVKKTLVLIDISEEKQVDEHNVILKLKFISKEAYYLSVNRLYSSYSNTVSTIIKSLFHSTTSFVNTVPSTDVNQYIIPGFTKTKTIQYLLKFTKDYLCFENNEGFVLEPVSALLVPSTREFKFTSTNSYNKDLILDFKELNTTNTVDETYNNIYKRDYITYNPNTKSIETVHKNVEQEQADLLTLGSGKNYSQNILDSIETKKILLPYYNNNLTYKSISHEMFNKKYEILVAGDLSLDVGMTINIKLRDRFNTNLNQNLNGLYLITKVAHHFSSKEYYTKLRIEKNAYFKGKSGDIISSNVVV